MLLFVASSLAAWFKEYKNGGLDFRERDAFMACEQSVTPLTSQLVACSLTTSHVSTCLDQLELKQVQLEKS